MNSSLAYGKEAQVLLKVYSRILKISEQNTIEIINSNKLAEDFLSDESFLKSTGNVSNLNNILFITLLREDNNFYPVTEVEIERLKTEHNIIIDEIFNRSNIEENHNLKVIDVIKMFEEETGVKDENSIYKMLSALTGKTDDIEIPNSMKYIILEGLIREEKFDEMNDFLKYEGATIGDIELIKQVIGSLKYTKNANDAINKAKKILFQDKSSEGQESISKLSCDNIANK